jgi:HPt (histidine-containing phosphotransfer) domain-containing protein
MDKAHSVSQASRVNLPELLSRVDNDRELLLDLLTIFKEEFPRLLQTLHDAVALQDLKQTSAVSHTLKGMLLNMSIPRAAAAAALLERLAQEETKTSVPEAFAAFEMEVQGLLPEMESCMGEVAR